jgi:hypothetical protein
MKKEAKSADSYLAVEHSFEFQSVGVGDEFGIDQRRTERGEGIKGFAAIPLRVRASDELPLATRHVICTGVTKHNRTESG